MSIAFTPTVSGLFKLEVQDASGNLRTVANWTPNLITDAGLDRFGTVGPFGPSNRCLVGSGNSTPSVSDTSLQTQVGFSTTAQNATSGAPTSTDDFGFYRITYVFNPGTATGNLTEIGIGWSSPSTGLFTRALIRDINGNPTTITILSTETLFVTYEFRYYQMLNDAVGSITIAGVTYNYTARSCSVGYRALDRGPEPVGSSITGGANYYNGRILGPKNGTGTGGTYLGFASSNTFLPYVTNSYYTDYQTGLSTSAVTQPFDFIVFETTRGGFQVKFDQLVPKSNSNEFLITFRLGWSRRA
jgi:hypothetical protein